MSIRYTLRRLNETDATTENLKDYELASIKPSGRVVIRLGDQIINLVDAADDGAIEASRLWAVSEESPDGEDDAQSPTGKTMSSRSWALAMIEDANEAVNNATQAATTAQTAAQTATTKAQEVSNTAQQINTKLDQANATAQQINSNITTINQRLTQTESNLTQSTTLLNNLIDITDAEGVSW